ADGAERLRALARFGRGPRDADLDDGSARHRRHAHAGCPRRADGRRDHVGGGRHRRDGGMSAVYGAGDDPRELPLEELLKRLANETSTLVRQEIALARAEMREKAEAGKAGGAMI